MRNSYLDHKLLIIICIFLFSKGIHAQLGFCQGNSGDPIFTDNFGTGTQDSPLPVGTTTYAYANNQNPNDGLYTVSSNSNYFDWFSINDHTPNDTNGRMLIVNSDFTPGEFYRTTISGLCENTTYEFSSWLINLSPAGGFCGPSVIPINVRFEIWDNTDTNLLASGTTGNITSTPLPDWNQYALVFQSLPSQTSVILKMINNGSGGCGNDLAIDDIVFKSCGDTIIVEDDISNNSTALCSTQTPFSTTISAIPDNIVFSNQFYQWQSSSDNINWSDITGETNAQLSINNIISTTLYRAKVAEFAVNLNNEDCITFSDIYAVNITEAPAIPILECWESAIFDDATCSWIVTGSQPAVPTGLECWESATFNNTTCLWEVTGIQPLAPTMLECWETTTFNTATCLWEINGTQSAEPTGIECWESTSFNTSTCAWEVIGTQPLAPTGLECWESATFNNSACLWEVIGVQPTQPNIDCWETTNFDNVSCTWIISGTQPASPIGLECWETASFNNTTCLWEVVGNQPSEPINLECWETTSFSEVTCSWEIIGSQPAEPTNLECWQTTIFNNLICAWEVTGAEPIEPTDLLCWQTTGFNEANCEWEILGTQPIAFRDEFLVLCEDESLTINVITSIENPTSYIWSSGELTSVITVNTAGIYEVEVTNNCFTEIITYNVSLIENPVIETVVSNGSSIIVNVSSTGDYLYSLDGVNYQFSNVFSGIPSNRYTVFVRSGACDVVATEEYLHFFIPKFLTPNADGVNDFFSINVLQYFIATEVYIFDRYGKLLFSSINKDVNWDGTFNGNPLPTSDYWYRIVIDGQEFKGHFTLKR